MNKINIPAYKVQYFHLNVYNIFHQEDIEGRNFTSIVAPDSYVALAVFTSLYPLLSPTSVIFVHECVSVFPQEF